MPKKSNTTVIFKKGSGSSATAPNGVAGSTRAGQFICDAINGTDSLDVIVMGDSNAGWVTTGASGMYFAYGYTCGLLNALGNLGARQYATSIIAGALDNPTEVSIGVNSGYGPLGTGVGAVWPTTALTGEPGATGPASRLEHRVTQSDADAIALKANLGYSTQTDAQLGLGGSFGPILPRFMGFPWDAAFVPRDVLYTSGANKNTVRLSTISPIVTGQTQTPLQYRCVYGKFASGSGQFRPAAWSSGNAQVAPAFVPTSGGSANNWYGTTSFNFNGPTVTNGVAAAEMVAGWDNFNQGSPVTGPFACLWHSVIRRNTKGFAVNPYLLQGGAKTENILARMNGNAGILDSFLKEIKERQVEATGSGRALVWINIGINGNEASNTWTSNMNATIDKIIERWVAVGNDPNKLCFVISATHPAPGVAGWSAARPNTVSAAASVANTNASKGVTAVDIESYFTSGELLSDNSGGGSMYDPAGQAHLSTALNALNGYDAISAATVSALTRYI